MKLLYGPGQRSVLHIKDDDWKRVRQIISPVFSAAKLKQVQFCMYKLYKSLFIMSAMF